MPKVKYGAFLEKIEAASAFSFRSVENRMGRSYAKIFIHNLKKRKRIIELMKGWYTFKDSPYLITIPLGEAYVGLGAAAHILNAWDQIPNIDILTTRAPDKVRIGERTVAGRKVIIRRLDRRMYFGYETLFLEETRDWIRVSCPEKTLIDLIYYNYPFAEEIIPGLAEKIDKKKLMLYLKRIKPIRGSMKVERELRKIILHRN